MTESKRATKPASDEDEAPELTDELIDRMVEGTMAQAGGRSVADLERYRDDALISVMETLAAVKARHGMAPDA